MNQIIEDLEDHRQSILAHIATIEGFIRDETQSLEILKALDLALALDEVDGLDDLADELDEEEGEDESI